MSLIQVVAVGLYFAGDGFRGLPGGNSGLIGSCIMIVAGVLFIVSGLT